MEFTQVLESRYSCRKYADKPVEREKLIACAEAGRLAPSSCNTQRWAFVLVDEEAPKKAIADALYDDEVHVNTFSHGIPAFIVVVGNPPREINEKQKLLLSHADSAKVDVGIAAENICLAATDLGLGSVMMGWFKREPVEAAIALPRDMEALLIIGVGYPLQEPVRRTSRLPKGELIRLNSYHNRYKEGKEEA